MTHGTYAAHTYVQVRNHERRLQKLFLKKTGEKQQKRHAISFCFPSLNLSVTQSKPEIRDLNRNG